ncbi:MAG: aspartate--tRNA ligase [Clostridia bacterium]|nr:aspartate--tRNA ligase [Clostridia bacterium]
MTNLKRTHYCSELRIENKGEEVVVAGWVQRQRDLGKIIFTDLRDRTGIVQLSFDESTQKEVFEKAVTMRSEYVVIAKGEVKERSSKNPEIPTGDIEIFVKELRILSKSETPPFEISENCKTGEMTRLKHRYLDLRRPDLQKNIMLRHKITKITRDYFDENGFIEIETPILIKSTPEGARDFLVPSRLHQGSFYALPQSPQLYKQLSMVAGFDRYMQIARCFRDEDLRADRQPEFTQIDLEMSFVDMEDILEIGEGYIKRVYKEAIGVDIETPIKRLTYAEAMSRYGSDKPDTRFEMELYDLSDTVKDCGFGVFTGAISAGGSVRGITAKNAFSVLTRKEVDKLTEFVRGIGAKGLAYARIAEDGTISSSFGKFMTDEEMENIKKVANAENGDVILIVGDTKNSLVLSVLGALRNEVANKLDIIPKDKYNFVWITEFPFFDWDEDLGQFVAMHHPFTSPMDECIEYLETDRAKVRAKAYDLVLNGTELSSGSIRITDPELQNRMFALLGMSVEEAYEKFGYLLDAFKYGAPPHGGMGIGLDRLVMTMLGCETLRDVIAFPKDKNANEPMTDCPSEIDKAQLDELGIEIKEKEE